MKPIRVLAVLEAATVTGPAKNLLQFAALAREATDAQPVQVELAVFRRSGDSSVLLDAAQRSSIVVHPIAEHGAYDRDVVRQLADLTARLRPDIVQTHAVKSHLLGWMAGFGKATPWVAFHHGYTWQNNRVRLFNQLDRWSLRHATVAITVSQPFLEDLVGRGVLRQRIHVVHNSIDSQWGAAARQPEAAAALRAQLGIGGERNVGLIVGRLSLEKDHVSLFQALKNLPGLHLVVVGDGPERAHLKALADSLQIEDRLTFTGQVPSAEPYYGIADVAILSSRTEGSPNALLEAMAARVPAVATRVGGIPEIAVDRESALLVPPGDPKPLQEAIREVLNNELLRSHLVKEAYQVATLRHSPKVRVQQLCRIYRDTVRL